MFRYYYKIAIRNLWRNKGFSAITIFGLAIGLATCLLITLFVTDELRYEYFNGKADRIYRINADFLVNGSTFKERNTPALFGPMLQQDYPQVEKYVRFLQQEHILVKKGEETLLENNVCFADSTVFDIFSLHMIAGNPLTALRNPFSMVISESMARKYFKSVDVVGKTLHTDNINEYTITGVIKDVPPQSHLHFDFIRAMSQVDISREAQWMADNFVTYVQLRPGTTQAQLDGYLQQATKKYMENDLRKMTGSDLSDLEKKGGHFRYLSIPLKKIHLYSDLTNEAEPSGNIQYVYIFIITAIIILLIACVNFMNLSTARSAGRAKEVGLRKVMGSQKSSLIIQFLAESVLTSCCAMIIAIVITSLLIPYLNELSGKSLSITFASLAWILPLLLIIVVIVGLLAGSYPAFFLSSFEPVKVLKGKLSTGFKSSWLRNSLVIFQFAAAILLIVGTLVIYNQLNYIHNKKLGYNRQQVLVIENTQALWIHAKGFRDDVLKIPGVTAGTMTNSLPTDINMNTNIYSKDAARSPGQVVGIPEWYVDVDYIPALGMQMAKGRNFSADMPTDTSSSLIINETAARLLGFTDITDKYLYRGDQKMKIIGIVKDFNSGSLRTKTPPAVLTLGNFTGTMAFRINTKNIQQIVSKIGELYHARPAMQGQPFRYAFMDDNFNRLYQAEERTGKIFISFAVLAILIASLGVFGLITYAAEQRTKEIGIRKVLGASVSGIVALLSADFLKLIALAAVIATPLAWLLMNKWLENFAYRININWIVFAVSIILMGLITMVTISFKAIKAALVNPVKSLRSE
ncbi:ABC transporter permease [Chitinophaga filiformis]|uniref:Putative ABC transport system permease protein n=1 Tax=Chitinophaga filiformis TaxID=104663 RepID=A0A1G7S569_CHIFI|nr:ABC transporter permease [Chitinophaga filiformis]SDG18157.1 putative ABC transport system permease protein [Chitinophaga filiformis]